MWRKAILLKLYDVVVVIYFWYEEEVDVALVRPGIFTHFDSCILQQSRRGDDRQYT